MVSELKTEFEKFVNGLQWRKDFDAEHDDHLHAASIIFGSVYDIYKDHSKNLDGAFRNVNLANLIGSLLDEGWIIEEIATECFIEPKGISLYYHQDNHLYYAVISH